MARAPHIVFAGGSTPGHLHPGLAVAAHLIRRMPEAVVTFVGGIRGAEQHVVRAAGFRCVNLPAQAAPSRALHAIRFVTDNIAGYWAARWFLKENAVSLVVGLGGAASAPAVQASVSRAIPVVLLEQNVMPGRVTRWFAPAAAKVCGGFESTRSCFTSAIPFTTTGNPARPAFEQLYRQLNAGACAERAARREKRLVVIGGAGGSRSINENIPRALARLRTELAGWQIVHQSGEGQLQGTVARYREADIDAFVVAFIDEMAPILFESDLVVCRSGGTTLAELALAGVPAVLVPHPPLMEAQLPNAERYASFGAASLIDETEVSTTLEHALVERLRPLLADDARRLNMAQRMRNLAMPDAAAHVTDAILAALEGMPIRLAA